MVDNNEVNEFVNFAVHRVHGKDGARVLLYKVTIRSVR